MHHIVVDILAVLGLIAVGCAVCGLVLAWVMGRLFGRID